MPPAKGKAKAKGKNLKNQHQLCDPLAAGEILTDLVKKSWKIGKPIGSGGFGLLYMAEQNDGKGTNVKDSAEFVVKIEPQTNGPLFCECAFYQRAAKPEQITEWKKSSKVAYVPIPPYIAQGRHEQNKQSLRFMVMPRFGTDLHKLWLQSNKHFSRATVAKIAIIMINALEYVHSKTYVHADIKGANILTGFKDPNKLFLVDFGLATKYTSDDKHYEYKADPRKAHNGTIEYTSKDAHLGAAPSRRGDIEILGYNLLHWVAGKLPWEDKLTDPNYVRDKKIEGLEDVNSFVEDLCPNNTPVEIIELLQHSVDLNYDETPDYEKLRNFFKTSLKSMKVGLTSKIVFGSENKCSSDEITTKPIKPPRKKSSAVKKTAPGAGTSGSTSGDSPPARKPRREALENATNRRAGRSEKKKVLRPASDSVSSEENSSAPPRRRGGARGSVERNGRKVIVPGYEGPRKATNQKKTMAVKSSASNESGSPSDSSSRDESSPKKGGGREEVLPGAAGRKSSKIAGKRSLSSDAGVPSKKNKQRVAKEKKLPETSEEELISEEEKITARRSPRIKKTTSRHSMAPLHLEPVLTTNDKLTGEFSGKHPKFLRRRKVNVQKSTISTQTTPSLKRGRKKT